METYSYFSSISLPRKIECVREMVVNQALNCPDEYRIRKCPLHSLHFCWQSYPDLIKLVDPNYEKISSVLSLVCESLR